MWTRREKRVKTAEKHKDRGSLERSRQEQLCPQEPRVGSKSSSTNVRYGLGSGRSRSWRSAKAPSWQLMQKNCCELEVSLRYAVGSWCKENQTKPTKQANKTISQTHRNFKDRIRERHKESIDQ